MKCFECNNVAEHQHHVIPKVKGGNNTIPLCSVCHSKAHDKAMAGSYLTTLGLLKSTKEYLAYIFWHYVIMRHSIKEISIECEKSERWVKKQIKRMRSISSTDLMDILYPQFSPSVFYDKEHLIKEWNDS